MKEKEKRKKKITVIPSIDSKVDASINVKEKKGMREKESREKKEKEKNIESI